MCFERIVLCDACGSEGLLYHGDPDDGWIEDCPYCEGTGGEILLLLADSMSVIAQSGDAVKTPQHIRQHLERRPLFNASDIARAVMEYREANPPTPATTN